MSHRLSRKEIKRDEVLETLTAIAVFLRENARFIMIGLAIALAAILVGVAVYSAGQRREVAASERLADAIELFSTVGSGQDEVATGDGAPIFQEVVEEYSRTAAATIAEVYLGEVAALAGDFDAARRHWETYLSSRPDTFLATEVRLNLMALDRQEGEGEALASRLQAMADAGTDSNLPPDLVLFQLGVTLDSLGRVEESTTAFERLVDEFPASPYSVRAGQKIGAPQNQFPGGA